MLTKRTFHRAAVAALPAAAVAGLSLIAIAPAGAAFPGADGTIAFHSDRSIYTIDAAGKHKVRLPEDVPGFGGLSVSADGMRIAYSDGHEIHVMNADGSGDKTLTDASDGYADDPAFSPDGRHIAYERGYGIWVMSASGKGQRSLTPTADFQHAYADPTFSPDGRTIAYTSQKQVWTMHADGTGQRSLTPPDRMCPSSFRTMEGSQPSWSPDGKRIAFTGPVSCANSRGTDIWVMNADGSGKTNLGGDDATEDHSPAFSPDGARIAFTRDPDSHPHLFTMGADGSAPAQVRTGLFADDSPDWGVAYETVRISEKLSSSTVRRGGRVVISGRIAPSQRGKVTLLIRRGGKTVARKKVTLKHARYRYAYRARKAGRYTVVATFPKGAHRMAGASPVRKLRVR